MVTRIAEPKEADPSHGTSSSGRALQSVRGFQSLDNVVEPSDVIAELEAAGLTATVSNARRIIEN